MRLLVFGQTGQVARALAALAGPDLGVETLARAEADLTDPSICAAQIGVTDADVIINAAAHTAVDRAEEEEDLAHLVNAEAPAAMAAAAAERGLPFLHLSTDYVFDGSGARPWREDDPTGPLGAYGRSKLAGEAAVAAAGGAHVILRTAWVFSEHGANFVKTMLRLGAERPTVSVVDDQTGGPTAAADIAAALVHIARAWEAGRGVGGVFHYAGEPHLSWAGFARAILAEAGLPCAVSPIATADWPTPARRPANSRLDCTRIAEAYGLAAPDWRPELNRVVAALAR